MATYDEIRDYVKKNFGFYPKTCWIAHMKELCGLPVKIAPNRYDQNKRTNPCPLDKQASIKKAFQHFGMI